MLRRSSRVRFSDTPVPPANSLPIAAAQASRRSPAFSDPRSQLDLETRATNIPERSSVSSTSSIASDPFGLQDYTRPSSVTRVSNQEDSEAAFEPQPLRYPRMSPQLARLSSESRFSQFSSTTSLPSNFAASESRSVSILIELGQSSRPPPVTISSMSQISSAFSAFGLLDLDGAESSATTSTSSSISLGLPKEEAYAALLPLSATRDGFQIAVFLDDQ